MAITSESPWANPLFEQTAYTVLGTLFVMGLLVAPFRKRHPYLIATWASLKSWLVAAPLFFFTLGLGEPWPLVVITLVAIACAKEFFQLTGMYHMNLFVWLVYAAIIVLAVCVYYDISPLYDTLPMILLGIMALIPVALNFTKNTLQFVALSLFNFIFLGWGLMHLGKIVAWENGPLFLVYVLLLTEICDNTALAVSRLLGKRKLADKITHRRTVEGFIVSILVTIALSYLLRNMLSPPAWQLWFACGLIAALAGSLGDLSLSVIRRDLGVKDAGAFIIGRGGLLDLMDRAIFVGPLCYYIIPYIQSLVS